MSSCVGTYVRQFSHGRLLIRTVLCRVRLNNVIILSPVAFLAFARILIIILTLISAAVRVTKQMKNERADPTQKTLEM